MNFFKSKGLSFKFSLMYTGIAILILIITFELSFFTQSRLYSKQREESIQYVADYLEKLIKLDDEDFLFFQDYFIEHHKEYKIPVHFDFDECNLSREKYETLFAQQYPGMVLGKDITFAELSKDVKDAYAIWNYEYYRLTFEEAAKSFHIAYAYYLVPTGEPEHMYWFLDIARDSETIDGEEWLALCLDIHDPVIKHKCMWEAWNTGKRPKGYDIYDDSFEYGMTYAYYTPLFINEHKLGVIGVEVEIKKVNHEILVSTLYQMVIIAGLLIIFMILFLITIRTETIKKFVNLRNINEEGQNSKLTDSEGQSSEIKNQPYESHSDEVDIFDALTGIRNKYSFDKDVQKVEWEISCGCTKIGIAITKLNMQFDNNSGSESENKAIGTLCNIVCDIFAHSPVYRIDNDKFGIILKKHDLSNIEALVEKFNRTIKEMHDDSALEEWEKISAKIRYAIYDSSVDINFGNLIKRADC